MKTETLTGRPNVATAKKSVTPALKALSPATRSSVVNVSLTPKTKKAALESYSHTTDSGMRFENFAPRRSKLSNCTRRLIFETCSSIKVHHDQTRRLCKGQNQYQVQISWSITRQQM